MRSVEPWKLNNVSNVLHLPKRIACTKSKYRFLMFHLDTCSYLSCKGISKSYLRLNKYANKAPFN